MNEERDFGAELDWLKAQMIMLQEQLGRGQAERQRGGGNGGHAGTPLTASAAVQRPDDAGAGARGALHYAGSFRQGDTLLKWEPQAREADALLEFDSERAAKILAALGHKQRLDILRALLVQPQTGAALVEQLQMGTTGQLYHHIKALAGADLLRQEERGGLYAVQPQRLLPILLLLAATDELRDTSDYIDMSTVREHADEYFGASAGAAGHDPHTLLQAVLENSLMEHEAGHCNEIHLFLHGDGSVTVVDNGRGIPTSLLAESGRTRLSAVMTELDKHAGIRAEVIVPGSSKGIHIAVVNAMSLHLQVEVRREGRIWSQSYSHGIPQHPLLTIGVTNETGTSVTFSPDPELFAGGFDRTAIDACAERIRAAYPDLAVSVHG